MWAAQLLKGRAAQTPSTLRWSHGYPFASLPEWGGYDSRPEYTLAGVDYAALLDDGSVAIDVGMGLEIRVFSEQGVFLRALDSVRRSASGCLH